MRDKRMFYTLNEGAVDWQASKIDIQIDRQIDIDIYRFVIFKLYFIKSRL